MAGQGGNEATAAEGGLEYFPAEIKRAGEKLLRCFTNPMMGVISVWGVGRWKIAEYASRKLNDSHLFHLQMLVKLLGEDFSLPKAQKEIMHQLGMTRSMDGNGENEEIIDTQIAAEIYNSLIKRKFLLLLGDVEISDINFELIGDPNLRQLLRNDSKIVLVGPTDLRSDMSIKMEGLSMNMLHQEAADIARSPSIRDHFSPKTILDCFLYMLLFEDRLVEVDKLRWHCRAEGFIITEGENLWDLLRELQVRSLVKLEDYNVMVPSSLAEKAEALVTSTDRSRFWIKVNSIPTEDDKVEDIERMVIRGITKLRSFSPKCPKLSTLFLHVGVDDDDGDDDDFEFRIPDNFFEQIKGVRVLHLEKLANESLPKSVSCLHNLKLLKLTNCPHLQTLLSSFPIFDKLEFPSTIRSI